MSLLRQARIVLGLLILISVLLTWLVHPGWMGVVAFLGASLIFSGTLGVCGTTLLLSWLPGNRHQAPEEKGHFRL